MGFYKFTASNAPISQSNYIKTKLKPVNTVDLKDGAPGRTHKDNKPGKMIPSRLTALSKIATWASAKEYPAGTIVKVGKTKYRAKVNITTLDTQSPNLVTAKWEEIV